MLLVAKLMLSPVLVVQAVTTRTRLLRLPEPERRRQGVIGRGQPLRLLIAGDSSAAGVGVQHSVTRWRCGWPKTWLLPCLTGWCGACGRVRA